jgi:hypothetical protein
MKIGAPLFVRQPDLDVAVVRGLAILKAELTAN